MSETLVLASRLQALDDDELIALLRDRWIDAKGIRDYFDLADRLLEPASIELALTVLTRPTLSALADRADPAYPLESDDTLAAEQLRPAAELALTTEGVGGAVRPLDAVSRVLAEWPARGLPAADELGTAPPPPVQPAGGSIESDRLAAERAFTATAAVAELIHELRSFPVRELAKGGVAAPDGKRLAAALGLDASDLGPIIRIAERAGLVSLSGMVWSATEGSLPWLLLPATERWTALATAWLDALPADIGAVLRDRASSGAWGDDVLAYLDWLYPAGGQALATRAHGILVAAEHLGISAEGRPGAAARALLGGDPEPLGDVARGLLPPESPHVYLQHDLSVVAPGPLTAAVDIRLRMLADIEGRGLASTYRISAQSLTRGLTAGETKDGILSFFREISLTGVPQPVEYLVADASSRHGLLRAGATSPENEPGARSYVRSEDAALLSTLAVDHGLSSLALVRSGPHRLTSRFPFESLYWMIADARYPVTAEDGDGVTYSPVRSRPVAREEPVRADPLVDLVARLREAHDDVGGTPEAWIARQLEVAVRAKSPVSVSVSMPDGTTVDFSVTPLSLSAGRLRAIDVKAGIERTLPLRSITLVSAPAVAP
jgi:hypothetical protein